MSCVRALDPAVPEKRLARGAPPRVTAAHVAAAAGVSRATVSYVFNRHAPVRVSAATRARVLAAAQRLGYAPNPMARALRGTRTGVIGIVVGNIDANHVGMNIVRAVGAALAPLGYHTLITDARGAAREELAQVRVLVDRAVDGLVFNGPLQAESIAFCRDRGLPVVMVERYPAVPGVPGVHADNVAGSTMAVSHLQRLGHGRIGYVGLSDLHTHDRDRFEAAVQTARGRGLTVAAGWIHRQDDQEAGPTYAFARDVLQDRPRPTAIYAGGILFAIEVLRAAGDLGLHVPRDLSVISFDDPYAELTSPRLTTVAAPADHLAAEAAGILLRQLEERPHAPVPDVRVVPPRLTVRESTGPAPGEG